MPEIINTQRKVKLDLPALKSFVDTLPSKVSELENRTFTLAFIPDTRMKDLNRTFRGKNSTTDVLSFPYEADEFDPETDSVGEIAISAEQAQKQAAENGLTLVAELKQLILHGVLHLCGYDHETDTGEMNARELEFREILGI